MAERTLADALRLAKKRSLDATVSEKSVPDLWKLTSKKLTEYKETKKDWPKDDLLKCLDANQIPFIATSEVLQLAIDAKDVEITEKIIVNTSEIEDSLLVEALLLAVRAKKESMMQMILQRPAHQPTVMPLLRKSSSIDDCLVVLEEAGKLLNYKDAVADSFAEDSVLSWAGSVLDSHFFGFAQRLGFSNSTSSVGESDDVKHRLESAIDQLLEFADERSRETKFFSSLLSLVESNIAVATNRLPSAKRYSKDNAAVHREYAVRIISL